MKALVSIITVNYNGLRDTCEMIDSFRNHETYPHYEIIVVDNGSRLPETEEIQERYRSNLVPGGSLSGNPASDNPVSFPPVKVMRNINNGFAGGNNAGLKAAGGDYLFFINNDTLIKEPVLEALVRRMECDPQRNGGVSPMLKFAACPDILQYAGFTPLSSLTLRNALFIKGFGAFAQPNPITYNGPFPINKTEEAHGGNYAAELVSIDTTGSDNMLGQKVPKVTAGSIFLGTFVATNALKDPMTTTLFGIEYTEKPLLVKGFFKYTPGTEFYNSNGVLEPDTKDECALSAVLYEVEDVKKETLDGNNIYTSDKIVASAVYTNTGTSEYTPFELKLEYKKDKEYDPNKKYKFAVIFSASKDGAAYNAAVGSRLLIDDVTIVNE